MPNLVMLKYHFGQKFKYRISKCVFRLASLIIMTLSVVKKKGKKCVFDLTWLSSSDAEFLLCKLK